MRGGVGRRGSEGGTPSLARSFQEEGSRQSVRRKIASLLLPSPQASEKDNANSMRATKRKTEKRREKERERKKEREREKEMVCV